MSDNGQTQEGSEQSGDLFAYIGQSEFQAGADPSLVEQMEHEPPVTLSDNEVGQNVDQAASTENVTGDVTTPPQLPTTESQPAQSGEDEALRIQQRIQQLEQAVGKRDMALGLLASQAKQLEETLFNRTLELMTPEEQTQALEARRIEQLEAENHLLRTQESTRTMSEQAAQERVDKIQVVHKVADRLGLPVSDQIVMQALMESDSPAELFAKAQRLAAVYGQTQQMVDRQTAQAVAQSNVHRAGGETAPAAPSKKTAQRSGELVDMMRERNYTAEEIR
jgi:hypothetical protein